MVSEILADAGVQGRRGRFTNPRPDTYAVWMDDVTTDGPDGMPRIFRHDITLELYETKPDDAAETAIEEAIAEAGLQYTKQDRYWIQSEQMYQVIYSFNYIEKRRT